MTPQQLKNAILQLAIQGKLVEQRKEEGAGEELFKEIQKEKKKLIKEGKLKKQKTLPDITEEEIPFDIPETWKWVRLGDSLDVRDGTHDSPKYVTEGFPLVTSKNLKNGIIDFDTCKYISEFDHIKISERSKVDRNDILFAMIGSIGNPVLVSIDEEFSIKNMALFKNIYSIMDMTYVYWFLLFSQEIMKKQASGGVQSFVSLKFLREYLLPLPPLAEQKRIVEKIEQLLPLVDRYEKAWTRLEELNKKFPLDMQKAILQEAIQGKLVEQRKKEGTGEELYKEIQEEKKKLIEEGKLKKQKALPEITKDEIPFDIPETWKWVKLIDLVSILGDGIHGTPKYSASGDYYFINGNNLNDGKIELKDTTKKVDKQEWEKYKKNLDLHTILISINGTIGNIAFYNNEKIMLGKSACYFNVVLVELKNYLFFLLKSDYFLKYALHSATGATIKNVSLKAMSNFIIPLPPLAEQKRIVEKIEQLLPLCEKLK